MSHNPLAGAAFFWKGRAALFAILKTLEISRGDAVVVPGYTCVVVPAAVHFAGAKPLYADIDPLTYNAALPQIVAAAGGQPVKAVIVQHTYGIPADVGPIVRWARERGIWVIEDACHVPAGGRYRDASLGESAPWTPLGELADAAFYSSQWSKPFTTGLGGWATAADPQLAARLRDASAACRAPGWIESALLRAEVAAHQVFYRPRWASHAQDALRALAGRGLIGSSQRGEIDFAAPPDYARRMAPWQERLARKRAAQSEAHSAHRRRLARLYDAALAAEGWPAFQPPAYADPVLLRYPLRVPHKAELLAAARRERIELGDWFDHPLHPAGANVAALGWREGLCPQGELAAAEVVNLPLHARIDEREIERTVAFLRRALAQ